MLFFFRLMQSIYQDLSITAIARFAESRVEISPTYAEAWSDLIDRLLLPRLEMKLWIDADAAPRDVKEICYRASERLKLETILVANQRLQLPVGYAYLTAVRVDGGPDVADLYIAEHAVIGDVAVTQDIPLAALLVPKGVVVIDPRGDEYTAESIGERLSVRNFMDNLRSTGVDTGGHSSYGAREKQAFANALDRALTKARRK